MVALRYLLLVLALAGAAESLLVSGSSRRSAATQASSASTYHVVARPKSKCTLPPSLQINEDSHDRQQLLDAVASPLRKTKPFLWLHYGDGDFESMTDMTSNSFEGADLESQCVRDGIKEMFLGSDSFAGGDLSFIEEAEAKPAVYESLGAFFLCKETNPDLHEQMERFAHFHPEHQYAYHDDFYFPVGNETSLPKDSWVVAARQAKRPVVIVGPKHLDSLQCMLGHTAFFELPIPTKGCSDIDRLVPQLVKFSQSRFPEESVLFVVAGGSIGKMIAYKAFQSLKKKDMFVDVGAALDAYAGRKSRPYNQDLKKFCAESKAWMAFETCKTECGGIRSDISCQHCRGSV